MSDETSTGEEDLEPLAPFASAGGSFELIDVPSTFGLLIRHVKDEHLLAQLRSALADSPALHGVGRLDTVELLERAAVRLMQGDLALFEGRPLGAPTIFGGAGTPLDAESSADGEAPTSVAATTDGPTTFVEIELVDPEGNPAEGRPFRLALPTGAIRTGKLDRKGRARVTGLPLGRSLVSFPEVAETGAAGVGAEEPAAEPPAPPRTIEATKIGIELVDAEDRPIADVRYELRLPDGATREGRLGDSGTALEENVPPGTCQLRFPDLDGGDWQEVDAPTPPPPPPTPPPTPPNPPAPTATVAIHAANGTDPPPRAVPVGQEIVLKAVPSSGTGSFQWATGSSRITLANGATDTVTVRAGSQPSSALDAEEVSVTFTPSGGSPANASVRLTVFRVAFSESANQKFGYDDMDAATDTPHHVSVAVGDTTVMRVRIEGGVKSDVLRFTSDDATKVEPSPPGTPADDFDLTITGKAVDDAGVPIRARANEPTGPVAATVLANVYAKKVVRAVVSKVVDGTVSATSLQRPNFDVTQAAAFINRSIYRNAVIEIELTDKSSTGGTVNVRYDLNGSGLLEIEPGGVVSPEEQAIRDLLDSSVMNIVIVRGLIQIWVLEQDARANDTQLVLKPGYRGDLSSLSAGSRFLLGSGTPNQELVTVTGTTVPATVQCQALQHDHSRGEALRDERIEGFSGANLIVLQERRSPDENRDRLVIAHECGHHFMQWGHVNDPNNLMNRTVGTFGTRLRFKALTLVDGAAGRTQIQWNTRGRP